MGVVWCQNEFEWWFNFRSVSLTEVIVGVIHYFLGIVVFYHGFCWWLFFSHVH